MNHVIPAIVIASVAGIMCLASFLFANDEDNDHKKRFLYTIAWNLLCACLAFQIWIISAIENGFQTESSELYAIHTIDSKDGVITQYIKVDGKLINMNYLFGSIIDENAKIRITKSGKYSLGMYFISPDIKYWVIKDGKVTATKDRKRENYYNDEK